MERAGFGRPSHRGRGLIEVLTAESIAGARRADPVAEAIEILETFIEDDEARQGALRVLRGEAP